MASAISASQLRLLAETIDRLRSLAEEPGDPLLVLLGIVESAIPSSLARFSAIDPCTWECIGVNTHVISEGGADLDELAPRVLSRCLFTKAQMGLEYATTVRLSDLLSPRRFWSTESWSTFYRPARSRFTMSAQLSPPGSSPFISIDLDRDLRDFSDRELRLFDLLRPYLREAYEQACRLERLRRQVPSPRQSGSGLVFDAQHRLMQSDGELIRWTQQCGLNRPPLATLPDSLAEAVWLHYSSFQRDDLSQRDWRLHRTVQGPQGPISFTVHWNAYERQTVFLVSQGCKVRHWESLMSLGLTRREAESLFWLSEGKSNVVIASLLSISPRTVQKHLESVYRKTGFDTRTTAATEASRLLSR
jgi:DNA-binding CsgD family transcriptional regulator